MKALSIRQPWAWLIVNGYKDIENRSWHSHFSGALIIHSGKKFDRAGYDWVVKNFPEIVLPESFECGGMVGTVLMTGCTPRSESPWFFGEWGFEFSDPKPCTFQAWRGKLGFFDIPGKNDRSQNATGLIITPGRK